MGSETSVLATTYKTYVRQVLENGTEVFVTAPANALATLDRVQNQALRMITGGIKTTPIAAMEQYSNVEPLNNRREKTAATLHEKLIRLDQG
jgi:ferredoxin-NADP reductase